MGKERIYLSSPTMHGDEQRFVNEAFETNWIAPLGPNVNAFEKEMAEYTGCGYAAALSAGTAAIHLALRLIGIQPGDVVLLSPASAGFDQFKNFMERGNVFKKLVKEL